MNKKRVLFVCTGNTCRSPLAEAFLSELAGERYEAQSAGIYASAGNSLSSGSAHVLKQHGIEFDHKSELVTDELIEWADIVLTMSRSHKSHIKNRYEKAEVYTLNEVAGLGDSDVVDPYGGSSEIYEATAEEIKYAVKRFIEQKQK